MKLDTALTELIRERCSRASTDAIIRAALAHARAYLRWLMWNRNYTLVPLGMSIDDLAADTIAELVSEIDGEHMARLRRALLNLTSGDDAGLSPELALKAVVLRTVRLNLARVFMEMQPVRARLLRSLRRFAQSSPDIVRHEGVAGFWYSSADHDARLELPPAPQDVLHAMLNPPSTLVQPAPAVLKALLDSLRSFPELRQAIAEDDVLDITLTLLHTDQESATPVYPRMPDEPEDALPLKEEALAALSSLRTWVISAYVSRGKLRIEETEAMLTAAARYITDLARGEERGHYSYLRDLLPDLTHESYRAHHRNVYEYILRTVFTTTRQRMQLLHDVPRNESAGQVFRKP